jgi:hypothetical protein
MIKSSHSGWTYKWCSLPVTHQDYPHSGPGNLPNAKRGFASEILEPLLVDSFD